MDSNPYYAPRSIQVTAKRPWRPFWKYSCIAAGISMPVSYAILMVFEAVFAESKESPWFAIVSGLIALLFLVSFTLAGIFAVLWILSPKAASK